jgi:predicted dehydrogenase
MSKEEKNGALNFVVVGCGRIAQTHLQALATVPECRLQGVVDERESAAESVANQFGCKAHTDYRESLHGNQPEAAIICTPPATHAEIACFFLEHGIHVLSEKPLAVCSEQAAVMLQKAETKSCVLMMASKFRYVDDVIKAKAIVESGILGDVVLFENVFCSKVDMRGRWNSTKAVAGGGVLIDNGCHSVDLARFLLGPIVKVQAEEGKRVQLLEVEDTARLYFRTHADTMGAVDLSWSIHKEQESYIDLYGTDGVLSIGWKCSKYRQSEKLNWVHFGEGYNKIAAFTRQIKNFVGAIKGQEAPLITAKDGYESVKVIEAAYRSAKMNKWVQVEP